MTKTLVLLMCALALTTSAWAGGSGESSGKKATVTWWAPNFNDPRSDTLAARFMKDNPNITIDVQKTVSAGLQDKILVAIQSGTTPDIIDGQLGWVVSYAATGQLSALDDGIARSKSIVPGDFVPGAWNGMKYNGKVYGIPVPGGVARVSLQQEHVPGRGPGSQHAPEDLDGPPGQREEAHQDLRGQARLRRRHLRAAARSGT